ncbi:hypothetical protein [Croceivirga radicis]|uniref:hypothetical protein n=1 Tax=Croceivirga radicis TaxID=1929488 RepID=UPI000255AF7E|nr:hypothetical protein [Croceivirga radicis]
MVKYYMFFCLLFVSKLVASQELKTFTINDFDLKGQVKTCSIITDYGKEILEFNKDGFLLKSTTVYNNTDRDVTLYKFDQSTLTEVRNESYKENRLDTASSLAYLYERDTTDNLKIIEHIISYDKEFFETQEYFYDKEDKLIKIISSHENAVDEIVFENTTYKGEETITKFENGILQSSTRTSYKLGAGGKKLKVVLEKQFVDGDPKTAIETVHDPKGLLKSEVHYVFNEKAAQFTATESHLYSYNKEMILEKATIRKGNSVATKGFVFQFDNHEPKNWVKKITTPDNTYITRKINYYEPELETKEVIKG